MADAHRFAHFDGVGFLDCGRPGESGGAHCVGVELSGAHAADRARFALCAIHVAGRADFPGLLPARVGNYVYKFEVVGRGLRAEPAIKKKARRADGILQYSYPDGGAVHTAGGGVVAAVCAARQRKRAPRHRQSICFPGADCFAAADVAVQPGPGRATLSVL